MFQDVEYRVWHTGTREAAFVQALSAASLAHTLAVSCSAGAMSRCGCGELPTEDGGETARDGAREQFRWGGCSDDVDYGVEFTTRFANGPLLTGRNRDNPRSKMNLHNNIAGLKVSCNCYARVPFVLAVVAGGS